MPEFLRKCEHEKVRFHRCKSGLGSDLQDLNLFYTKYASALLDFLPNFKKGTAFLGVFSESYQFLFQAGYPSAVALRYPAFSILRKGVGLNEEKSKRAPHPRWLSIEWSRVDILLRRKRKNAQFALGQKNVRNAHSRLPALSAGVRMGIV